MQDLDKAKYLTTIVSVLKNAGDRRKEKDFYGAAMLVAGGCGAETLERFQIVSMDFADENKNEKLFSISWFLALFLLFYLSYAFTVHPNLGSLGTADGMKPASEAGYGAKGESFVDIMRNTESARTYLSGRH